MKVLDSKFQVQKKIHWLWQAGRQAFISVFLSQPLSEEEIRTHCGGRQGASPSLNGSRFHEPLHRHIRQ